MIDLKKWDAATSKGKLEFIEGLLKLSNTQCMSKHDWEVICNFLLEELHRNDCIHDN